MKFFRRTAGYKLFGNKRKEENLGDLKVESVDEKLRRHKSCCLRHVARMNNKRVPKIMLNYKSNGRRRIDRLVKRLLDDAETGH